MNVKLPKVIVHFGSIPLAILAWTLILGLGSSHVYADDSQTSLANKGNELSLNLFSRDSEGGLNLTPSVSVSTPLLDVEVPSIKANESSGKLSVSELKVDTSLGSAGTSEIGVDMKKGTVELPSVKADTSVLKADVSSSEVNLNEGTASLPGVTAEVPEVIKRNNSVKGDRDRTESSSYASESRGALDMGLNVNAEGQTSTVVESIGNMRFSL
ncbi:hypothetical protein [Paenibacillus pabuli]|uniref:hypothetical protein n=1 Tax=Paenibacillus pabuli TaxID=1472 RepID=UPI001FFFD563|nr:hypothetical protein [Paenibacillus pabuli]UPK44596.1 hypothetical protein KET34_03435 [Paenibacillus pabuli]